MCISFGTRITQPAAAFRCTYVLSRVSTGQDLPSTYLPPVRFRPCLLVGPIMLLNLTSFIFCSIRVFTQSDPYATYNNLTLQQLYTLTPTIPRDAWRYYFQQAGLSPDGTQIHSINLPRERALDTDYPLRDILQNQTRTRWLMS